MAEERRPLVVSLGGINIDLVAIADRFPAAGETVVGRRFLTYPGGKGANQAVAAARMGAPTAMVGRVGNDLFGPQVTDSLAAAGVDVSAIAVAPEVSTGIAVIIIDAAGQNRIIQVLGANDTCGAAEAERVRNLLDSLSVLLLQLEVSVELSLQVAQAAAAAGKTVILDPSPVRPLPAAFYDCCSIITPNETDAAALVGFPVTDLDSAARAADALLSRGVGAAIITLGEQGAYYATADGGEYQPPFPVDAVDSVGAGDAFNGALAAALAAGQTLPQAAQWAAAGGALAVTKVGAQDAMPTSQEVAAFLSSRGIG